MHRPTLPDRRAARQPLDRAELRNLEPGQPLDSLGHGRPRHIPAHAAAPGRDPRAAVPARGLPLTPLG
jgi:hypothetical protein